MPVAVTNAVATGTLPHFVALQFTRSRGFTFRGNTYADGSVTRQSLGDTSRSNWAVSIRLRATQAATFRSFWDAHVGSFKAFYFYQPEETTVAFDPAPTGTTGRYIARFGEKLNVSIRAGGWTYIDFDFEQLT